MIWIRTGELEDWKSTWHLVEKRGLENYLDTLCGVAIARGADWVNTNEPGWEYVKWSTGVLCVRCIEMVEGLRGSLGD